MRFSIVALAGAIVSCLSATNAMAQFAPGQYTPGQYTPVLPTAYEYNSYYAQDFDEQAGAKERGVEGQPDPLANVAPGDDDSFGNGNGTFLNPCCDLGEEWRLFDNPGLERNNTVVQGWIAWNPFIWNTSNPADRFNGPVTFTDRSNTLQMNQLYLFAERATDTGGYGWDWGYRVDALYGSDARFTQAAGLETWNTNRFYGLALPQFYAEAAYDDLKVKIGHFYAPVGYEVVTAPGNFFPSVPYTFQYGEAFTMTGFIVNWQASDDVNFGVGGYNGWDNFTPAGNPNYSLVLTYTENFQDDAALAYSGTIGNEPNAAGGFSNRYVQTLVYSRPLSAISERLTYVGQTDFGYQNDALAAGGDAYWYGLNQYLFYTVSDCMSYAVRAEWFRDQDGFRVGGFQQPRGLPNIRSGYPGSFYEVTFGANYKYSANTVIRPYIRLDWFSGTSLNGPGTLPFDNGTGNSQTLLGFDWITLF